MLALEHPGDHQIVWACTETLVSKEELAFAQRRVSAQWRLYCVGENAVVAECKTSNVAIKEQLDKMHNHLPAVTSVFALPFFSMNRSISLSRAALFFGITSQ